MPHSNSIAKSDLNCKKKTTLARKVKSMGGSTTITRGSNTGVAKKKSSLVAWIRSHTSTGAKRTTRSKPKRKTK